MKQAPVNTLHCLTWMLRNLLTGDLSRHPLTNRAPGTFPGVLFFAPGYCKDANR